MPRLALRRPSIMLDPTQRRLFTKFGFVRLKQAVDSARVAGMRRSLWQFLTSERGIFEGRRETWPQETRPTGFQKLSRSDAFAAMLSPVVRAAVDDVLGPGTAEGSGHRAVPLVVFPEDNPWCVPGGSHTWHVDAPVHGERCTAVRAFLLLDDVENHRGPTLVVAGSACLARSLVTFAGSGQVSSRRLGKVLSTAEPWIRDLMVEPESGTRDRFLSCGASSEGLPLRVMPFVGKAGDVVLMDLASLHSKSANATRRPRLVVGQTFWRASTSQ
ncbi:MAG: hypothetical protein F4X98_15055 [Gammaproteobacteria bacterium]|nr:hypothetical protein [Gammaproteobacteria bacterium]